MSTIHKHSHWILLLSDLLEIFYFKSNFIYNSHILILFYCLINLIFSEKDIEDLITITGIVKKKTLFAY